MSTTALHRRLRREMPWLTPQFNGDDDELNDGYLYNGEPNDPRLKLWRRQVPPLADADAIPALTRPALTAPPEPLPIQPTPEIPAAPALQMPTLQRRPQVIHNEGRPTPIVFGTDDPEQQVIARRRALEAYQPQKESVKKLLLRTGLNMLMGGAPAAIGTLGTGLLDRRGQDRAWQQQQLGQLDESLGRMRTDRRTALQDDLLESQVRENQAQAVKLLQPPPVKPPAPARRIPPVKQVDEAGNEYLADAETGEPLLDAKGNLRYTGRAKAAPPVKPDPNIGKYEAAKGLLADLGAQEEDARLAKDRAWESYHAAKKRWEDAGNTNAVGQPDVIAAKKAVDDAEAYYKSFWGKKNAAKADMKQYEPRAALVLTRSGGKYAGQRISRAKLPEAAKRLNMSEAEAEAFIKREGGAIY